MLIIGVMLGGFLFAMFVLIARPSETSNFPPRALEDLRREFFSLEPSRI